MRIPEAPRHRLGYFEARPGDVAGRDDLLLVDVRPEEELTGEHGHIHGVRHVPSDVLMRDGLRGVAHDAPIVLVSSDGRASAECAAHLAEAHGFLEVYNLVGGMVRWAAEERPVARVPSWR